MRTIQKLKKMGVLLLAAALLLAFAVPASAASYTVQTTKQTPLVHSQTLAPIVFIGAYTSLTVISDSDPTYYLVSYANQSGFVSKQDCVVTSTPGTGTTGTGEILYVKNATSLYERADIGSQVKLNLPIGQQLTMVRAYNSGIFYYATCQYNGQVYSGFVPMADCSAATTGTTGTTGGTVQYYIIPTSQSYLYYSAATTSGYSKYVPAGASVGYISTSGSFYYAYYSGTYGYIPASAFSTIPGGTGTNVRAVSNATVYANASTSSRSIGTMYAGDTVTVYFQTETGGFSYIGSGGQYGYVASNALGASTGTTTTSGPSSYSYYVRTATNAPLYSIANTSGIELTTIPAGTTIGVITTSGSFYQTYYNGVYGYVLASQCTATSSGSNTTIQTYLTTRYTSNLYSSSSGGTSIGSVAAGQSVGIINETYNGYYYVYVNGQYGYMLKDAFSGSLSGGAVSTDKVATYGTVMMGSILYSSDDEKSEPLGRVAGTGQVSIIAQTTTGFYYVKVGNYTGYFKMAAVTVANDATLIPISDATNYVSTTIPVMNTTGSVTAQKTGTVGNCVSWVSLRESATSSSERLAKVTKGSSLTILGTEGSYTKVNYAGTVGYILTSYVV